MKVTFGARQPPIRLTNEPMTPVFAATRAATRRFFWLPLLVGAAWLLLWAAAAQWPGGITAVDINQHRANVVVPAPQANRTVEQQFTPRRDGLAEIELLVAVSASAPAGGGFLALELWDDRGRLLAAEEFDTAGLRHNQPLRLTFSPQPNSSGRSYTLRLSADEQNWVSVWGYSLDTHAGGALAVADSQTSAADLRFVTRYQLAPVSAVTILGGLLRQEGAYILLALALILLPGCLILLTPPPRSRLRRLQQGWDPLARLGMALALGLATWPLLWQWFSLAGGRWSGWLLWLFFGAGWGLVLWRLAWPGRQLRIDHLHRMPSRRLNVARFTLNPFLENGASGSRWRTAHTVHALLLILLIVALAVRLLAVRDLVFAPWVDSVRHALITAVMTGTGQAISGYRPWLPVDGFPYHYGFHTLSASLALMTEWPLPRLLLIVGQLLNALVPLTVYSGAWFLTRRRPVALLAAFLVALPFFFPAYYATWGRLTQLAAMLMMPLILAWTWLLVSGSHAWRRHWWLLAVLVAGLFLIHVRVFLIYLPFAAVVWLLRGGRNGRYLLASASLSLLLVAPRLLPLLFADRPPGALRNTIPGYNVFPTGYVTTGWERHFLGAAAVAAFIVVVLALRRRPAATLPLGLILWVASLFFLLAGDRLGLPETWLVNLNSMYITLFLPLALLLAIVADQLWRLLATRHWLLQTVSYAGAGALLAALLLFGARQQITILNPQTLLAQTEDAAALAWLDGHLPPSAYVAVNGWLWLGGAWSGSDGGAWVVPLTGRRSSTPPADYSYNLALFEQVATFNEQAQAVTDWSSPAAAEWLRQQAVTHVFVGARGGFFDPAALARNPALDLLYAHDGAFIFAIKIGGD
jgi:hypothetical protein